MTDQDHLARWMARYVEAWRSNEPDQIASLFTEDAEYSTEPYAPPWRGRDQIVARWLVRRDDPAQVTFTWAPVAVTSDVCVIEGTTLYAVPPSTYANLWVIDLDGDGRCRRFTEWWMRHPDDDVQRPGGVT